MFASLSYLCFLIVGNQEQAVEAARAGADIIMFDNMKPKEMAQAVKWLNKQKKPNPETEASGGISLSNIRKIAGTGVDYISIGTLTNSPGILDISLLIV